MDKYIKNLLKLILGVFLFEIGVISCTVVKPIAVQDSTSIQYHYIDSINYIDSTVYHHIYKEYYNDYTNLLDTLNLENTYSKAQAYVDTTNKLLKGSLTTKDIDIPVQIKYKEKVVYKDSIIYQRVEVPIPVEVTKTIHPKYEKWLWIYLATSVIGIFLFFYLKKIK